MHEVSIVEGVPHYAGVRVGIGADSSKRLFDLHPLIDDDGRAIAFRVVHAGHAVCVEVSHETLHLRFGVQCGRYELLATYEANRECIDAAVTRAALRGDADGTVRVRVADLFARKADSG